MSSGGVEVKGDKNHLNKIQSVESASILLRQEKAHMLAISGA